MVLRKVNGKRLKECPLQVANWYFLSLEHVSDGSFSKKKSLCRKALTNFSAVCYAMSAVTTVESIISAHGT